MANIPLFKGGWDEDFETFLRDFKRACIFGIIDAHTQEWLVGLFPELLEGRTLTWFERLPIEKRDMGGLVWSICMGILTAWKL
jgi:hypothetical protein